MEALANNGLYANKNYFDLNVRASYAIFEISDRSNTIDNAFKIHQNNSGNFVESFDEYIFFCSLTLLCKCSRK